VGADCSGALASAGSSSLVPEGWASAVPDCCPAEPVGAEPELVLLELVLLELPSGVASLPAALSSAGAEAVDPVVLEPVAVLDSVEELELALRCCRGAPGIDRPAR
jgi:hypothetical protein